MKHGEFENVELSGEELGKLTDRLGPEATHDLIEDLSCYLASKGKRYKSHYATLLMWARMDRRRGTARTPERGFVV